MIVASGLTKTYGAKTAVDGISFTVEPGRVTGFLGPNGAGKSTTMRMILGLDRPTAGSVTVNGRRYADSPAPLREVGALLEAKAVHPGRSARNHLRWLAASNGIPAQPGRRGARPRRSRRRSPGQRVGKFSLGMGQRLGIAVALLGDPRVVVLDEPVNGLDPEGIRWVRNLARRLAAEGRTVFVSSHLMSEMALTADHLVVIGRGRVLADCSMADFIADHAASYVRVRSPQRGAVAEVLRRQGLDVAAHEDGELRVQGLDAAAIGELVGEERPVPARADPRALLPRGRLHDLDRRQRGVPRRHSRRDRPMTMTPTSRTVDLDPNRNVPGIRKPGFADTRPGRVDQVLDRAVDAVVGGHAVRHGRRPHRPGVLGRRRGARQRGPARRPAAFVTWGLMLAQIAAVVLGAMVVTSEYGTGMIRATLLRDAEPRRRPGGQGAGAHLDAVRRGHGDRLRRLLRRERVPRERGRRGRAERRRRAAGDVRQRALHGRARAVRRGGGAAGPPHGRRAVDRAGPGVRRRQHGVPAARQLGRVDRQADAGQRRVAASRRRSSFNPMLLDPWVGFAVFTGEVAVVLLAGYLVLRRRDA